MPDPKKPDDFEATMKAMNDAAKHPDDDIDIAADDQGASALAQKIDLESKDGDRS